MSCSNFILDFSLTNVDVLIAFDPVCAVPTPAAAVATDVERPPQPAAMSQDPASSSQNAPSTWTEPPWSGWIETTGDALLILEAARRGLIPRVTRRLVDSERKMITSGSVFVFDEDESGIKRWTDGFFWSPSRILGNFLLYRETEKRGAGHRSARADREVEYVQDVKQEAGQSLSRPKSESSRLGIDRQRERSLVGSLTNSYKFKPGGMMKKVCVLFMYSLLFPSVCRLARCTFVHFCARLRCPLPCLEGVKACGIISHIQDKAPSQPHAPTQHKPYAQPIPLQRHSPRRKSASFRDTLLPHEGKYAHVLDIGAYGTYRRDRSLRLLFISACFCPLHRRRARIAGMLHSGPHEPHAPICRAVCVANSS